MLTAVDDALTTVEDDALATVEVAEPLPISVPCEIQPPDVCAINDAGTAASLLAFLAAKVVKVGADVLRYVVRIFSLDVGTPGGVCSLPRAGMKHALHVGMAGATDCSTARADMTL